MMNKWTVLWIAAWWLVSVANAADWPTYQGDSARTGYTNEQLSDSLTTAWTYRAKCQPQSAWPTRNREQFDRAYQPVIAGDTLLFGSSADGKVYALDAGTGDERWTFYTNSPIRFAPTAWRDRLFVASDDGNLYCLTLNDGRLLWKFQGGASDDMVLGNEHIVSRWPVRGGPVVAADVLYFGAGIWPSEKIFIHAVDPNTGKVLWCNDSTGRIEMDQPHPTARANSGIASQGYLAVLDNGLIVPTGRGVPAVFDRRDGTFKYCRLQQDSHAGGSDVVAADGYFYHGGASYDLASGTGRGKLGAPVVAHPNWIIAARNGKLVAFDRQNIWTEKEQVDRKGSKRTVRRLAKPAWSVDLPDEAHVPRRLKRGTQLRPGNRMGSTAWSRPALGDAPGAIIATADKVIVAGNNCVLLIDIQSRTIIDKLPVEGVVHGLAVADHRLYASSDRGMIRCFETARESTDSNSPTKLSRAVAERSQPETTPDPEPHDLVYANAANEIIRRTGITRGYCVDLSCGDGRLALNLAKRTELRIYAVSDDADHVREIRRMIDEAGLYGTRVTVHYAAPATIGYPNYFADLVVSGRSVTDGAAVVPAEKAHQLQRPYGGAICIGRPEEMRLDIRNGLAGAGWWTHQNTDPQNTLCSSDERVRGPLEMLWYRDTQFVMPSRHGRGPAPLVADGRMFVEGLNGLQAVNIYNGRVLWELPLENILWPYHGEASLGVAWTGSNYCVGDKSVFVHTGNKCLRIDAASGTITAELLPPPRPYGKAGTWGYIAHQNGLLFGSLVDDKYLVEAWSSRWSTERLYTESILLFAMDAQSGEIKWTFRPRDSIRHNAIAIGEHSVYLLDRPQDPNDTLFNPPRVSSSTGRRSTSMGTREGKPLGWLVRPDRGRLVAIDSRNGKIRWETNKNVFGTMLACSRKYKLLLMSYQPSHQPTRQSELADRMAVYQTRDGKRLWLIHADYESRPIVNGRTIYAQPGAWDLLTGRRLDFQFSRSYGCGIPIGSTNLLLYRSATLGYCSATSQLGQRLHQASRISQTGQAPVDRSSPSPATGRPEQLAHKARTENYGGIRPGCWVNVIPAGGLVLMADSASWCTCSYLNQATCALQPRNATVPRNRDNRASVPNR